MDFFILKIAKKGKEKRNDTSDLDIMVHKQQKRPQNNEHTKTTNRHKQM